jgi:hypothetical protein
LTFLGLEVLAFTDGSRPGSGSPAPVQNEWVRSACPRTLTLNSLRMAYSHWDQRHVTLLSCLPREIRAWHDHLPIRCGPVTKRFGGPTWATGNLDRPDRWRADQRRDLVGFVPPSRTKSPSGTGRRRNGPSLRHRPTERVLMSPAARVETSVPASTSESSAKLALHVLDQPPLTTA